MMYTIRVSDGVDKVIAKWKKSNPNLFKKYKKIYKELLEHPKTGLGHQGLKILMYFVSLHLKVLDRHKIKS